MGGGFLSGTAGTFTAGTGTVNFNGVSVLGQTNGAYTFWNLTLSGQDFKRTTGATVNGILSCEGTAYGSGTAPTYGANATLRYAGSGAQTTGTEFPGTWSGSGGVIIANTNGTVTLSVAKTINAPLTINPGATLNTRAGFNYAVTASGLFANYGTFAANMSAITLSGSFVNDGAFTMNGGSFTLSGTGDQSIDGFTNSTTVTMAKTGGTATFTGNVSSANLTINGVGGTLNLGIGRTHTFDGWIRTAGTLEGGSSTLTLGVITGTGGSFTAGTGTVRYGGTNAVAVTYNNLTLISLGAGKYAQDLTGATVNGILSIEGMATTTGTAPTYGAAATLQYKSSERDQTTGIEFPATWSGSGGVIIANSNTRRVFLGADKTINAPLTINLAAWLYGNNKALVINGAVLNDGTCQASAITFGGSFVNNGTFTPDTTITITFSGSFVNNGTFTPGSSAIILSGTDAQNISGFTTTGLTSMTKTAGTATFTGNVNGVGLTINGSGGTLNLGTGLTHTFTSTWTMTAGTVEGGSSTLILTGGSPSYTGGSFTAGTGTVNYNKTTGTGAQTLLAVSYNNLIINTAGTMPAGVSVTGNLSIAPTTGGAKASIASAQNLSVGSLTLGGLGRINGTWGSTSSSASSTNNTYFALTSGRLTVTTDTRTSPSVTTLPAASSITYGQALTSSTLTGGSGSVPGSFVFTDPSTVPSVGNYSAAATVTLGSLSQNYDGSPHAATATTDPVGLTVNLTYNGTATAPTAVGNYAVVGTVNDATYGGSTSGTLAIAKAVATFDPPSLPRETTWVANGAVNAVVRTADRIYLAGNFTYVGPNTGFGVPLDPATQLPAAVFPKLNGGVTACVPDGSGGYYVAGYFTQAGSFPRNGMAHIKSDGTVDAAWNPNPNYTVRALAVSGDGTTIYAGGQFTQIGGAGRSNLAALDAATGAATAWNPNPDSMVVSLAVVGTTVYVGGNFGTIGGASRNRFAALEATTGAATAWNPAANNSVDAMAVVGTTVYAAGWFTSIGGQARSHLAAIDTTTSTVTAWDPNANNMVNALAVSDDGATVYAGGSFTTINGTTPRNRITALGATTGTATAWDPNAGSSVYSLAVLGTKVYAGGAFRTVGGQTRNYFAVLEAATGLATSWELHAGNYVNVLAVSGTKVYAGGDFTSLGGVLRNRIAALDAATGVATTWNPNANGEIYCLAVSGSTVYVGGDFGSIGGGTRSRLAALDATTGLATWADLVVYYPVRALAVSGDGTTVYVGGEFTGSSSFGGLTRNRLAAVTAATGAVTAWDPNANNTVYALAVSGDGSTVCAGGQFTTVGGQTRNRIAAIDATTGTPTTWNPNAGGIVRALAVSGWTTYAGGEFTTIGGQTRNRLAALDSAGAATAWNPNVGGIVRALAVSDSTVYAGGDFYTVNGATTRNYLAALDIVTGTATTWNPNPNSSAYALALSPDGTTAYAGGAFTALDGNWRAAYFDQFGPLASSTTTLGSSANPSPYGASVVFTATLSPSTASGTVTFKDGATTLGTGILSSGTATYTNSTLTVGSHSLTAVYSGDGSYSASTNSPLTQTVNKATPSVTTWLAASPITSGQALSASTLTGGSASVAGSFAFAVPATVPPLERTRNPWCSPPGPPPTTSP
ncbi:MAG: MBG domain-containing protein [Verrucomicrobiota bacterium]